MVITRKGIISNIFPIKTFKITNKTIKVDIAKPFIPSTWLKKSNKNTNKKKFRNY